VTSLVIALLALHPSSGPDCRADSPAVREARAVATGIVDGDNKRDLERVLGYYAPDAVLMPPGEGVVQGIAAIRPRYAILFEAFDPQIELSVEQACASDGLAFVRGRNRGWLVGRAGGAARELDDVFVMLLRRTANGAFRISHLVWHRGSPEKRP
jgi:ketosteroid isomerase-like protein